MGTTQPEYACGCPAGEGCNIDCVPALLCEELIGEYRKSHGPKWDIDISEQEAVEAYTETPNQRRKRNTRAKKATKAAARKVSK